MSFTESRLTNDFKSDQKKYSRVNDAYKIKETVINKYLVDAGLDLSTLHIVIKAVKYDKKLYVYGKDKTHQHYKLLVSYDFCTSSGKLGPKRQSGDGQIPEGFYYIDRFNPQSTFHLSLGINYPNTSDKKLTKHSNPGGDIFIHGDCVTIGCIPITDDKIKELYILAVEARNNGQLKIPVYIFPIEFNKIRKNEYILGYNPENDKFWNNLRKGYDYFETHKKLPQVNVGEDGYYEFK